MTKKEITFSRFEDFKNKRQAKHALGMSLNYFVSNRKFNSQNRSYQGSTAKKKNPQKTTTKTHTQEVHSYVFVPKNAECYRDVNLILCVHSY